MNTFEVDLGERSYPIYIGQDLINQASLYSRHIHGKQILVVSNTTVAPLYLQQVMDNLTGFDAHSLVLPDGEKYKTIETINQIYDYLLQHNFDRSCTLIALGGGVIGDMTGFAAATYQRGVAFIQVPTTLLAQVDSSVGGKTGVNHPLGKNMIGAFHQPNCVIIDTHTLNTLEDRELSAGIAEIIKYGILADRPFFDWLQEHMNELNNRQTVALVYAIETSCRIKAEVVADDETEKGRRALLNLGHTFGHAIETNMGYGNWLHGEAVAVGMIMAADLSFRMGWIDGRQYHDIENLVDRGNLPTRAPKDLSYEQFIKVMARDKKALGGLIRLVLIKTIGEAVVSADYDQDLLKQCIDEHHAISHKQRLGL